ncbi:MAG: DUF2273 domain-containing protein [Firmicutes bacterium]|nr:DUF2273 domain-containing protein [Bacillota bacterium]
MDPQEIWDRHRGKILGVALGLSFGWFAIIYGLLKAIFVALCVGAGYYLGKRLDEHWNLRELWRRLWRERP